MRYIISRRVWVDENTNYILNNLYDYGKRFISREELVSAIIYEWVDSGGIDKINNVLLEKFQNKKDKAHYVWIQTTLDLWEEFKILCDYKDVNINTGFKFAVNNFMDVVITDSIDLLNYFLDMRCNTR